MRQFAMIMLISSCLIFSCSSKKGGHRAHGKKGKHGSSVASSSSSSGTNGASSSTTTTTKKISKTRFGEGRPRINTGGMVGVGSGGSYASNSYRRDIYNRDEASIRKKEYFKKRMEENDRIYFGEEVREEFSVVDQDSTSTLDSTNTLEVDTEMMDGDSLLLN